MAAQEVVTRIQRLGHLPPSSTIYRPEWLVEGQVLFLENYGLPFCLDKGHISLLKEVCYRNNDAKRPCEMREQLLSLGQR